MSMPMILTTSGNIHNSLGGMAGKPPCGLQRARGLSSRAARTPHPPSSLRLQTSRGELRLMTTVTTFATAVDVTLAELKLEAFLPADQATAEALKLAGNARQ